MNRWNSADSWARPFGLISADGVVSKLAFLLVTVISLFTQRFSREVLYTELLDQGWSE
jgi:hypothetical protein